MAATKRPEAKPDDSVEVVWQAQEGPQSALISCPVFEVFFGGARGGGKTDGVLGDFLEHADTYGKDAIGLMIRRQRTELVETIERSKAIYTPLGWTYHEQDKMWRAPNGARLRFAYLERDADAEGYQGHSYTRLYFEEIGNFPSDRPILKLMATLRSGAGVPVGFRATGNPGGPGHQWVRARYIDPAPLGFQLIKDPVSGLERVYIPSRVHDNKFLGESYIQQLKASGSKELVKAWLEGDWSVIEGAFFDCWELDKHVIRPFEIPSDWLRFRAADWGSAKPFSVGWWAVVGDDYELPDLDLGGILPRGALVRYREWYGKSAPNTGLKLTAEEVALGILAKEQPGEKITYGVIDPAAFAVDGGPSIAERMSKVGVTFRRADNKRVAQMGALGGWDQMRQRMKGEEGRPMIYCFSTCVDSIRTIPALQHDLDKPEDLDTDGEDHAADEWRYACMSRPYQPMRAVEKKPDRLIYEIKPDGRVMANMSVMELVQAKMRRKARD
jgi:terminase large subunit-like protein